MVMASEVRTTWELPIAAVWVRPWQKKIHLNLVSNIKRTCGVLGLSFKALNWYSRFNVMYWMCIQLCYRGQSCICCVYSENELAIRICSQITKKYIDWHENPALRCYLTFNSLMINLSPVSVAYVIPSEYFQMKLLTFSPLSFSPPLQVQLLYELLLSWSSTWARLQRHGILRQTSSIPEPPAGAAPSSPVRSSAGTALPDTSTCSPSAEFGSPTEVRFSHLSYTFHFVSSVFLSVLNDQQKAQGFQPTTPHTMMNREDLQWTRL